MPGVVLVDDQQDIVELMRAVVEARSSSVEVLGVASSGSEAIDVVRQLHPELVVIDHHMPLMTGIAAARAMLETDPSLQIVLCSAYLDDEVRQQACDAGIRCCLSKDRITELGPKLDKMVAAA